MSIPLTDEQLVKLLVCQAQGLDKYYVECDKLPDGGEYCFQFCPFGVTDDNGAFPEHANPAMRRLLLMYYAAKRLAELRGIPIEIHIPYTDD